jgi:hypothetical protein
MSTVLDLAKLRRGTLFPLKKRAFPKLVKHYNFNVILVGRTFLKINWDTPSCCVPLSSRSLYVKQ